jgi:hypothetical protein
LVFVLCMQSIGYAQEKYDSSYIEDHTKDLTIRALGNYKFSGYNVGDYSFARDLHFRTNDKFSTGIGFSYRQIGLNFTVRVPFINNDDEKLGKTSSLDLQTYIYRRKWIIDLFAQFYKGYYLPNDGLVKISSTEQEYLLRPDLQTGTVGFDVQYIFNNTRFSYRGAYVQSEYQKKSAGSFIAGGGAHYMDIRADSSVIPLNIADSTFFGGNRFNKSQAICVALSAGYSYTWVFNKHFFVNASAIGSIGVNATTMRETAISSISGSGLQLNTNFRLAAGYNSPVYYAGIQFIEFKTRNTTPILNTWQEFNGGYVKIVVAKRFKAKKYKIYEVYEKLVE